MTVNNSKVVVIVFLTDETARILAEGSDLVFERTGITDEFRFIKNLVNLFHNLVAYFNTHTDVNRAGKMSYVVFTTDFFEPFRTSSACCNDSFVGINFCYITVIVAEAIRMGIPVIEVDGAKLDTMTCGPFWARLTSMT